MSSATPTEYTVPESSRVSHPECSFTRYRCPAYSNFTCKLTATSHVAYSSLTCAAGMASLLLGATSLSSTAVTSWVVLLLMYLTASHPQVNPKSFVTRENPANFLLGSVKEKCDIRMRKQTCMTSGGREGSLDARIWGSRRSNRAGCWLQAR